MKNVLIISTTEEELLSNVNDGTNRLFINGSEIPSSSWVGTGNYTATVEGHAVTIAKADTLDGNISLARTGDYTYEMRKRTPSSGTGVESIVQTTTSHEDGGTNIVTCTLTDGTETEFEIRNGQKGSTGATGATPNISASASVDANTGTPSVTVTKTGTAESPNLAFAFQNLKGAQGEQGATGATPNVSASATVDANTGTPAVTVTKSGTTANPNFAFAFQNLKGANGDTAKIADDFDATKNYYIGDVVEYNNGLYRFVKNHSAGAWNANDVTETTVGEEIENYRSVIVTVPTSAWSSTQTSGYYTATLTTPIFGTVIPPRVSNGGADAETPATVEQMDAYSNIQNPNGYIEQLSTTSIKLYAKVKPTVQFYLRITGYGIGVQLDSCDNAITANKVGHQLSFAIKTTNSETTSGLTSNNTFDGSVAKKLVFCRFRVAVNASSWSNSANASGYYTYNLTTASIYSGYPIKVYPTGADENTRPTAAQYAAYRNICETVGYIEQTSDTTFVLYAKTKPTTTFYMLLDGMTCE